MVTKIKASCECSKCGERFTMVVSREDIGRLGDAIRAGSAVCPDCANPGMHAEAAAWEETQRRVEEALTADKGWDDPVFNGSLPGGPLLLGGRHTKPEYPVKYGV